MLRFHHTLFASLVAGSFFMGGVSAVLLLKKRGREVARRTLVLSLAFGLVASVLTAFPSGHEHAQQVARTQPEKFAAIEGLYQSHDGGAPMVVFAFPVVKPPTLLARFEIPRLLSWFAFGDVNAPVKGLPELEKECAAKCAAGQQQFCGGCTPHGAELWLSFVSFHNMVLLGMLFLGMTALGLFLHWRRRLLDTRWFLAALAFAIPLPLAACQLGWMAAEVGRQPWIVYGLLKTSTAASVTVSAGEVLFSILLFGSIYLLLGALYVFLLVKKVKAGPGEFPPDGQVAGEVA